MSFADADDRPVRYVAVYDGATGSTTGSDYWGSVTSVTWTVQWLDEDDAYTPPAEVPDFVRVIPPHYDLTPPPYTLAPPAEVARKPMAPRRSTERWHRSSKRRFARAAA